MDQKTSKKKNMGTKEQLWEKSNFTKLKENVGFDTFMPVVFNWI